jgi:DNA-binding transcriptional regulator YbjK
MADDVRRRPRGRERRALLLRAAREVIAERGVGAATHRAIAEAAGVPPATTTYYFATLDELLEEALQTFVAEEVARLEALGVRVGAIDGGADAVIRAVAAEVVAFKRGDPAAAVAQFDLYVEAARRPALRAAVAEALAAYRALAVRLLRAVGCAEAEAEAAAPLVVALMDGLGIHDVAVPEPGREERLVEGIGRLVATFGVDVTARPAGAAAA